MNWQDWDKALLALTMWREARGEGDEGLRAVGHVIANRVALGHLSWAEVMDKKWQFSSLTAPGDSQLVLWPNPPDPAFSKAMLYAEEIYNGLDVDLTEGATHYFNPNVVLPTWAAKLKHIKDIGHHAFYKS